MISHPVHPEARPLDDALVVAGRHAGVVLTYGCVTMASVAVLEHAVDLGGGVCLARLQAADDRRWRGACAAVLSLDLVLGVGVLGAARHLGADAAGALADLLCERLHADVADLTEASPSVGVRLLSPGGVWLRGTASITSPFDLALELATVDDHDVLATALLGAPVFTEAGRLVVGFVTGTHHGRSMPALRIARLDTTLPKGLALRT